MATIKTNIELVLKQYNAYGDTEIYNNVRDKVIAWIEDQSKVFRYNELKKTAEYSITAGTTTQDFPSDYSKIENAILYDSNGNQYHLQIKDIKDYDFLASRITEGLPVMLALDLYEQKFYFAPIPNNDYTLLIRYYAYLSGLTEDDTVFFTDKVIQQVAYIALLQYDRIDSTVEEMKLEKMLNEHKRNMIDLNSNAKIPIDKNTYRINKWNFEL